MITYFKKLTTLQNAVWALFSLCLIFFVLYIYFMNSSVFNVAKRIEAERTVAELNADLSRMEFEYIALENKIDINLAYKMGFNDIDNQIYVTSYSKQVSLSN
jgi:hypothetical protein